MKVTFVVPFINLTGGIRVVLGFANRLHDDGHSVTVVYPCWPYRFHFTRGQQLGEFHKHRHEAPRVPWFNLRCRLLRVPLIRTAFLPRADVVVATSWPTAHDVARLHSSRGRKVHLLMHHETGTGPEERIRDVYRLPFYRITLSESVRRDIERDFACPIDDVVPGCVDTESFFPDGERRERTLLMLYHPDPRKGANDGMAAFSRLRERIGPFDAKLCGTVRADDVPPWMTFDLHPDDRTLRRAYSSATAFLYSSRYEGFGLPPLEAMACGCPVVTTSVGAIPQFAVNGRNAMVVAAGDIAAMATALEHLLGDPALRASLAGDALATAEDFSARRIAPRFGAALTRALASA